MATCRHHHVCSAAVALGNVPVCLRLCAHICPLCVSHQGINTQSAVSHGDSRSFTAANQRQWAHLATPFTLQMAHKLCPFITPVNTLMHTVQAPHAVICGAPACDLYLW